MHKKNYRPYPGQPDALFRDVCQLIKSYGSLRQAAIGMDRSATYLSLIQRGTLPITDYLAGLAGWTHESNWQKMVRK